mmetsp:Transcript_21776/g.20909  ORF Transcript_21776/g.20909 Transcript_21776/m.20909 type:complete len:88 (-) Transcript_21776:759-1022(-)
MLSAWLQIKYPHVFLGALASSAPILNFKDQPDVSIYAFNDLIAQVFNDQSADMSTKVKEAWGYIKGATADQYDEISTIFNTCTPVSS